MDNETNGHPTTFSPVPRNDIPDDSVVSEKNRVMDFPSAIHAIVNGRKITKLEWNNPDYYGVLHTNDHLSLHKPDGKFYDWIVNDVDMMSEDWIVVYE